MDNTEILYSALSDLLLRSTEIRSSYMGDDDVVAVNENVESLYKKFIRFRNGLDQIETLLNNAIRVKAKVDNMYAEAQYDIEDAEVELLDKKTKDFQSSRDRSIEINATTITQRRALRKFELLRTEARAVTQVISNHHKGCESAKRDLEVRLRALSFITPYEK